MAFVDMSMFKFAPRFHAGLNPDEFPAILQRGEQVLSRSERSAMLNILRGGSPSAVDPAHDGAGQAVVVNIYAMDAQSMRDAVARNRAVFLEPIFGELQRNGSLRSLMRSRL